MSKAATHPEAAPLPALLRAVRAPTLRALADQSLARLSAGVADTGFAGPSLSAQIETVRAQPESSAPSLPELPWLKLAERLALSDVELIAGWLALVADVDALFAARLRELQGDGRAPGAARPTLGLVARAVGALDGAHAAAARTLAQILAGGAFASGLLRLGSDDLPASDRELQIHSALLPLLLGAVPAEGERHTFDTCEAELLTAPQWRLPPSWDRVFEPVERALQACEDGLIVVRSHDPEEARAAVAYIARRHGWRVAALRTRGATEFAAAPPRALEPWLLAVEALPLYEIPGGPEGRLMLPPMRYYRGPVLVAAGQDGEIVGREQLVREIVLPLPTPAERAMLWLDRVPASVVPARWRCSVAALHAVAAEARRRAGSTPVAPHDLDAARAMHVRAQVRRLGALAQPIDAQVDDECFVVGASERAGLDLFAMHCSERETLVETLGAVVRARAHPGVKALFVGASGTGKTLGAQWLAHSLGKPLLRVDSSAVTSKYIGETEKNLSQLLAQAEHLDCVLLFDEADALFGSRTDVKQANDRFANAQTNYLLTRIETFDGIAILTSNSKARFDDAFIRRLDAIVEFRLPGAIERRRLWIAHLGDAHGLEGAELGWLAAQFELPGGNIRNAVLGAALLARRRGAPRIGLADVQGALVAEYAKLGRPAPDGAAPQI